MKTDGKRGWKETGGGKRRKMMGKEGRDFNRRLGMGWEEIGRKGIVERTERDGIGWIWKGRKGTRRMCWNGVTWDKRDGFDMERGKMG